MNEKVFRTACHMPPDDAPCTCDSCTSKRRAAVAEDPTLGDDENVRFVGDPAWYSVRELRAAEGRRHSAADQVHLDTAALNAAKVLDRLHSAGARVPGTSQQREADIETGERAAESYAAPDPYRRDLDLRAAEASTPQTAEQKFHVDYQAKLTREFAAQRDRMSAHIAARPSPPRLTIAEVKSYAPPDPFAEAIKKHQEEERSKR